MRSGTAFTFISLAVALQGVAATGWRDASSFSCPSNTDNQCTDNEHGGWNFNDAPTGSLPSYKNYDLSGWDCKDVPGKRDLAERTGGSKCISTTAKKGDFSNSISCGSSADSSKKFSVGSMHVSTDKDNTPVEFHYDMPDGSTCKQTATCGSSGSDVANDQCGGATAVKVKLPDNSEQDNCGVNIHTVSFNCDTSTTSVPVPTTTLPTQPAYSTPATTTPVASTPVASTPVASTPVASTPVESTPVSSTPVASTPVESSPVSSTPVASTPVASTPVASTPVASTPIASTPVASTPVASTPVASTPVASTPVASTPVESTPASSTPVESTPVASTPAESSPVASTPVASTPVASTPVASTPVASTPVASTPVASTPVASTPVASTPVASTPVASTPVASTPVASTPVATTPVATTPVGTGATTPVATVPSTCTLPASCGSSYGSGSAGCSMPADCTTLLATSSVVPPVFGNSTVPGTPAESTPVPSGTAISSVPVPSGTGVSSAPVPSVSVPATTCPDTLPRCLKTWIHTTDCTDTANPDCWCGDSNFVTKVSGCLSAWAKDDSEVSQAVEYFMGLCQAHIPTNPAIVSAIPSTITLPSPPSNVPATTIVRTITTVVPCSPTTVSEGSASGSVVSFTTSSVTNTVTIPQVTLIVTNTDATLVYPTPAPSAGVPATAAPEVSATAVPGVGAGPTTLLTTPVLSPTYAVGGNGTNGTIPSASAPAQQTGLGAGSALSPAGVFTFVGVFAVALFQL